MQRMHVPFFRSDLVSIGNRGSKIQKGASSSLVARSNFLNNSYVSILNL
jgi:hypothetical protein